MRGVESFSSAVTVPLYAAFRVDILKKKITPFADARLGAFAGDYGGAFMSITAWMRFNRFNLSLGYTGFSGEDDVPVDCDFSSFNIRLGVDFGRHM